MVLDRLGFGKRRDPGYWSSRLELAQAELWKQNLSEAEYQYSKIISELGKIVGSNKDEQITNFWTEAQSGRWATLYLKGESSSSDCHDILFEASPTNKILAFVSKVLGLRHDTSKDAIAIYKELLNNVPSEKNANGVLSLLRHADISEATLDLLQLAASIISDDLETSLWICKWAIKLGKFESAEKYGLIALDIDPNDIEANRGIGYINERRKNWAKAEKYFRVSQEWVRQAVALNNMEDHAGALMALKKVPEKERDDLTWLYHAGWSLLKIGDFDTSQKCWQRLQTIFPSFSSKIVKEIELAQINYLFDLLENFEKLQKVETIPSGPDPYFLEAYFRKGLIELIINGDVHEAASTFNDLFAKYSHSYKVRTLASLSKVILNESQVDEQFEIKKIEAELGDSTLYLWLRGLLLIPIDPESALSNLEKAVKSGAASLAKQNQTDIATTYWLAHRNVELEKKKTSARAEPLLPKVNGTLHVDQSSLLFKTIATSFVLSSIEYQSYDSSSWLREFDTSDLANPSAFNVARSIYFARDQDWSSAVEFALMSPDEYFTKKLFRYVLKKCVLNEDWAQLFEIIPRLLMIDPKHSGYLSLYDHLAEILITDSWNKHNFEKLEGYLPRILQFKQGDPRIHHHLALLNTYQAMHQDLLHQSQSQVDHWKIAIGHWAANLTDGKYWNAWAQEKSNIYGSKIDKSTVNDLREKQIPTLIKDYFSDQENSKEIGDEVTFQFYKTLLDQEYVNCIATRHLIKRASDDIDILPVDLHCWVSPLLIREFGSKLSCEKILDSISLLSISRNYSSTIQRALSPFNEIRVLALSGYHDLALKKLEDIEKNDEDQQDLGRIRFERIEVLNDYTQRLIENEKWVDAIRVCQNAYNQFPKNHALKAAFIKSCLGWANHMLLKAEHENVVSYMQSINSTVSGLPIEFYQTYGEALVRWANEALDQNNLYLAKERFEAALEYDPSHSAASNGIAAVHMQYSINFNHQRNFEASYENAKTMYWYVQTVETATIYASACAQYALDLAGRHQFQDAIHILSSALELPYDRQEFQLEKLLSGILTDYGAILYNSGYRSSGTEMMNRALSLDPSNVTAMRNLNISRGYY